MDNKVIFNTSAEEKIRECNSNLSDILCFTDTNQLVNFTDKQNIQIAFANFISNALENKLNENFHNGLDELEQHGIISAEKIIAHEERVKKAKVISGGAVLFAFDLAPLVWNYLSERIAKENIKEFIIGWTAYINGKYDCETTGITKKFLTDIGIKIKNDDYQNIYNKYVEASQLMMSSLQLNRTAQKNLSGDNLTLTAKKITSMCDLSNGKTFSRASEFVSECLGIRISQAEKIVESSKSEQILQSDFIGFSSISYLSYFEPLINDISIAKKFAVYNSDCDPYSQLRTERRKVIDSAVDVNFAEILNGYSHKLAKIYISIGMAKKTLNQNNDVKKIIDIQKIKKKMINELV